MHLTQRIRRAFIVMLVTAFLAGWAGTASALDPVYSTYLGGAIRRLRSRGLPHGEESR